MPAVVEMLEDLPSGIYTCTADGLISFYNARAAELWGHEPLLNDPSDRFCGLWRLWQTDGSALRHDETPMAVALSSGTAVADEQVVIERPDASRVTVRVNIKPLKDKSGEVTGAVNVFSEIPPQPHLTAPQQRDDPTNGVIDLLEIAVYTTDVEGRILYYNQSAVNLWGRDPRPGEDRWCGSQRLFTPEGEPIHLAESPMAIAIQHGDSARGIEIVIERPDGTRSTVLPTPSERLGHSRDGASSRAGAGSSSRRSQRASLRERCSQERPWRSSKAQRRGRGSAAGAGATSKAFRIVVTRT